MMPGASQPQYGRDSGPAMGRDEYGQNVEMAPLTQHGSSFGTASDPNAILNECREIDKGIDAIEDSLQTLKSLQQRSLDDPDSSVNSQTNRQLDTMSSETMTMYRNFAGRIKAIKQQPESGSPKNAPQLGKVDRRLKGAINSYQRVDADFRKKLQEQMARQYRIVRPEASEQEVREAVEDTSNQQVFSQALLQSDRRGQSRAALSAVENRHAAIQKIESQMIELAELFQDMEQLVVQQEAAVVNIEMKGEEVVENMDKGTQQIGTAIQSARNTRKWKWWCLGICVLIVAIIVIVVLIYVFVIKENNPTNKNNNNNKRSINSLAESLKLDLPLASRRVISGSAWSPSTEEKEKRFAVPGLEWEGDKLMTERRRKITFDA